MKKILALLCALAAASVAAFAVPDDDYVISFDQLPKVSQSFVKTHFAKVQISYCLKDSHSYEVRFADASEIEFDYSGKWEDVDCKYQAVPASVLKLIPAGISDYVTTSFPTAIITKVKQKVWGYELELNTGLELEFNKNGAFMRIDD